MKPEAWPAILVDTKRADTGGRGGRERDGGLSIRWVALRKISAKWATLGRITRDRYAPAHGGTPRLQQRRDGRVRCSAWLGDFLLGLKF
jgi:hypothetical protein